MGNSMAARSTTRNHLEQRYIHLVRLAWDLRCLGLGARLEVPQQIEPYLLVLGAKRELRVVILTERGWVFRWGRGKAGRVDVLNEKAAQIILLRAAL